MSTCKDCNTNFVSHYSTIPQHICNGNVVIARVATGKELIANEFTVSSEIKPPVSILLEAQEVIYGDREKTYGDPSTNLRRICNLWNTYLKEVFPELNRTVGLSINDVCQMMVLLKVARLINDPNHRDSKVDIAGYAALMQRVQDSKLIPST